jgi:hypothetical protein
MLIQGFAELVVAMTGLASVLAGIGLLLVLMRL